MKRQISFMALTKVNVALSLVLLLFSLPVMAFGPNPNPGQITCGTGFDDTTGEITVTNPYPNYLMCHGWSTSVQGEGWVADSSDLSIWSSHAELTRVDLPTVIKPTTYTLTLGGTASIKITVNPATPVAIIREWGTGDLTIDDSQPPYVYLESSVRNDRYQSSWKILGENSSEARIWSNEATATGLTLPTTPATYTVTLLVTDRLNPQQKALSSIRVSVNPAPDTVLDVSIPLSRSTRKSTFAFLSNPFTKSHLSIAGVLPSVPENTTAYVWTSDSQQWKATKFSLGNWDHPEYLLHPGEGFFIQLDHAQIPLQQNTCNIRFDGHMPASGSIEIPASSGMKALGNPSLHTGNLATDLGFPAAINDTVYMFDAAAQNWKYYNYDEFDLVWIPEEPRLEQGHGFFFVSGSSEVRTW